MRPNYCAAAALGVLSLNFSTTVAIVVLPHPRLFEQPALLVIRGNFLESDRFETYSYV
jgi:hypothetical protein